MKKSIQGVRVDGGCVLERGGKAVDLRHGPMRVTAGQQISIMSIYFISTKSQFHPESQEVRTEDEEDTQFAPYRVLEALTV